MQTVDKVISPIIGGLRNLLLAADIAPVIVGPKADNLPGAGVILTPYPLVDNVSQGDVLLGVQCRVIGDAKAGAQPVIDRSEDILLIFGQLTGVVIATGITVAVCYRNSSTPVTPDSVGRPYISDSYYLRTDRRATEL